MFLVCVLQESIFMSQSCCSQSRLTNSARDCYVTHNEAAAGLRHVGPIAPRKITIRHVHIYFISDMGTAEMK